MIIRSSHQKRKCTQKRKGECDQTRCQCFFLSPFFYIFFFFFVFFLIIVNGSFILLMIFKTFSSHIHLTEVGFFPWKFVSRKSRTLTKLFASFLKFGTTFRDEGDESAKWIATMTNKSTDDSINAKPSSKPFSSRLLFSVNIRHENP